MSGIYRKIVIIYVFHRTHQFERL